MLDSDRGTFEEQLSPRVVDDEAYFAGLAKKADGTTDVVVVDEDRTEMFNLDSLKWRRGPSMYDVGQPGASIQYGDTFLVVGGKMDDIYAEGERTVYVFDPEDEEWVSTGKYFSDMETGYLSGILIPEDFIECY